MNVDAEIYIKQLIGFFDKNPEELKTLIGLMSKENFYQKIRDKVYSKVETQVENYILTKKEMGELIYQLHEETHGKHRQPHPCLGGVAQNERCGDKYASAMLSC